MTLRLKKEDIEKHLESVLGVLSVIFHFWGPFLVVTLYWAIILFFGALSTSKV